MKLSLAVIVFFFFAASSESVTQTDWSGGPGVSGPVLDLGSTFDVDTSIDWTVTGEVGPGRTAVQYWVEHFIGEPGNAFPVDLDSDGDQDVAGEGDQRIVCWENLDGSGTSWERYIVARTFQFAWGMNAADFDGDGDADIIAANYLTNYLKWFENPGTPSNNWIVHEISSYWVYCTSIDPVDMDGDGDQDFVANSSHAKTVAWWENNGSGTLWTQHIVTSSFTGVDDCLVEDLDGDGDPDIAASSIELSEIEWYENLGDGTAWSEHTLRAGVSCPGSIHCADVDNDSDPDLIAGCWQTDQILWFENTGNPSGQWPLLTVTNSCESVMDVEAGDFDSDGDLDLVAGAVFVDSLWWCENADGAGGAWILHMLNDDYAALRVTSADLDGDGRTGILAIGSHSLEVCWWDVCSLTGSLESSILDTQCAPDWGVLSYNCELYGGTNVTIEVRASDDFNDMGPWSDPLPLYGGSLEGILEDGDRYFQYRALIATTPNGPDPRLEEVTVTWDPLAIGEGEGEPGFELMPVSPNPCQGIPSIEFHLSVELTVEISLYDISGRLVHLSAPEEYQPGRHSVEFGDLCPGIYFVKVRAGDCQEAVRFVVVE